MVRSDSRGRIDLAEMRAERTSAYARPGGKRYRVFWDNGAFTQMQEFTNEKDAKEWRRIQEDRGRPAQVVLVERSVRARAYTRRAPRGSR